MENLTIAERVRILNRVRIREHSSTLVSSSSQHNWAYEVRVMLDGVTNAIFYFEVPVGQPYAFDTPQGMAAILDADAHRHRLLMRLFSETRKADNGSE